MACKYTIKTPDGNMVMSEDEFEYWLNHNYRYKDSVGDLVFSLKNGATSVSNKMNEYLKANSLKNNPNRDILVTDDGISFRAVKSNRTLINASEAITSESVIRANGGMPLTRSMDQQEYFRREWDELSKKDGVTNLYKIKSLGDFMSDSFKNDIQVFKDTVSPGSTESDFIESLRNNTGNIRALAEEFMIRQWCYQRTLGNAMHGIANHFITNYIKTYKDYKIDDAAQDILNELRSEGTLMLVEMMDHYLLRNKYL